MYIHSIDSEFHIQDHTSLNFWSFKSLGDSLGEIVPLDRHELPTHMFCRSLIFVFQELQNIYMGWISSSRSRGTSHIGLILLAKYGEHTKWGVEVPLDREELHFFWVHTIISATSPWMISSSRSKGTSTPTEM